MTDKIYVVTASANKGQDWIMCKALYGGILGSDIKKTAQAMLEREYQDIKQHGKRIPRKYFKLVEYFDNAELLKQIEQLKAENAALREAVQYLIDDGADCCAKCIYCPHPTEEDDDCLCHHNGDCVDGLIKWFTQNG
ncbi:MAG TPA: hypothetical protein IAC67_06695 [Candidatus Coproplasma excrementipullorum]|nr:hypothetical protein [Candidatus Coproplasma excrementipullorum]